MRTRIVMLEFCVEAQVCLGSKIQFTLETSYVVSLVQVILESMFSTQSSEIGEPQIAGGASRCRLFHAFKLTSVVLLQPF